MGTWEAVKPVLWLVAQATQVTGQCCRMRDRVHSSSVAVQSSESDEHVSSGSAFSWATSVVESESTHGDAGAGGGAGADGNVQVSTATQLRCVPAALTLQTPRMAGALADKLVCALHGVPSSR